MATSSITVSRARRRGPAESYKINVFHNQRLYDLVRLNNGMTAQDIMISSNFSELLTDTRITQNNIYELLYKMKDLLSTR